MFEDRHDKELTIMAVFIDVHASEVLMLVFIDESGTPHPNDAALKPTLCAVCFEERDARRIAAMMHALKRDVLDREDLEMKGRRLLTTTTFRRGGQRQAFVEEFFSTLRNLPIAVFAVVSDRPSQVPDLRNNWLPTPYVHLIQRIQLHASHHDSHATILFDGIAGQKGDLVGKFNRFLYRSHEGQSCTHITDAPFFVDSKQSIGIQIADMAATVIRVYEEKELSRRPRPLEPYYLAIGRFRQILASLSHDYVSPDGFQRSGFHRLGEEAHHPSPGWRANTAGHQAQE